MVLTCFATYASSDMIACTTTLPMVPSFSTSWRGAVSCTRRWRDVTDPNRDALLAIVQEFSAS